MAWDDLASFWTMLSSYLSSFSVSSIYQSINSFAHLREHVFTRKLTGDTGNALVESLEKRKIKKQSA
jgi:hypothetical protein